jgi:hypothetical protein
MSIRIYMYMEVDTDDPVEAYRTVYDTVMDSGLAWESSDDEWYRVGSDGELDQLWGSEIEGASKTVLEEARLSVKIMRDDDPLHPRRDWDTYGELWVRPGRYQYLGDKDARHTDDVERVWTQAVYIYDHSGIAISTKPFGDIFDSGFLGYIYIPKDVAEEHRVQEEDYDAIVQHEIHVYNLYIQGQVWGYQLGNGDSCWGFFGETLEETGMLDEVPEEYHENMRKAWEERQ